MWRNDFKRDEKVIEVRDTMVHKVFPALRRKGILARSNFLCCQSCAGYDLATQATKKNSLGYVFWHNQDEERIWGSGELMLAYTGSEECNTPPKNAKSTLEIGRMVIEELKRNGISYDWDGTDGQRICVLASKGIKEYANSY
jgi:hypothetical protein